MKKPNHRCAEDCPHINALRRCDLLAVGFDAEKLKSCPAQNFKAGGFFSLPTKKDGTLSIGKLLTYVALLPTCAVVYNFVLAPWVSYPDRISRLEQGVTNIELTVSQMQSESNRRDIKIEQIGQTSTEALTTSKQQLLIMSDMYDMFRSGPSRVHVNRGTASLPAAVPDAESLKWMATNATNQTYDQ